MVSWVTGMWERSTRRPKLLWVIRISARDVGEIYEKTEIVVGHPHLGAEFCRVWSRFHEGGFVGKTHPLERTDAEIFVDRFIHNFKCSSVS